MSTSAASGDLSRRLAALSPAKRALLERQLLQRSAAGASPADDIPVQDRAERRDFPLSSAQERMWFNHQWNPSQPAYNESFALRIRGDLKVATIDRSFDLLMERHEIFSTTFHSSEGRLFQRLGGCARPRLLMRDLRPMEFACRETQYQTEARRLVREPFVLDRGPLFRGGLWTLDEGEHRLE